MAEPEQPPAPTKVPGPPIEQAAFYIWVNEKQEVHFYTKVDARSSMSLLNTVLEDLRLQTATQLALATIKKAAQERRIQTVPPGTQLRPDAKVR